MDLDTSEEFDVVLMFNEALVSAGNSMLTVAGSDAILSGGLVRAANLVRTSHRVTYTG